jgi:uncharacterized membrane protein
MEDSSPAAESDEKETGRVEAFSDGVFGVAITLLILEFKVPSPGEMGSATALWHALGQQWPSYFAFVTSFFSVLIIWMNHHAIFRLVRRTSALLLFTNGLLLLFVTAVPFSTALVAAFLRMQAASTACAVYAGLYVLINIAYNFLLWSVARDKLVLPESTGQLSLRRKGGALVGLPLYIVATIAAFFSIWITLGICTGLWIYWAIATID